VNCAATLIRHSALELQVCSLLQLASKQLHQPAREGSVHSGNAVGTLCFNTSSCFMQKLLIMDVPFINMIITHKPRHQESSHMQSLAMQMHTCAHYDCPAGPQHLLYLSGQSAKIAIVSCELAFYKSSVILAFMVTNENLKLKRFRLMYSRS